MQRDSILAIESNSKQEAKCYSLSFLAYLGPKKEDMSPKPYCNVNKIYINLYTFTVIDGQLLFFACKCFASQSMPRITFVKLSLLIHDSYSLLWPSDHTTVQAYCGVGHLSTSLCTMQPIGVDYLSNNKNLDHVTTVSLYCDEQSSHFIKGHVDLGLFTLFHVFPFVRTDLFSFFFSYKCFRRH